MQTGAALQFTAPVILMDTADKASGYSISSIPLSPHQSRVL